MSSPDDRQRTKLLRELEMLQRRFDDGAREHPHVRIERSQLRSHKLPDITTWLFPGVSADESGRASRDLGLYAAETATRLLKLGVDLPQTDSEKPASRWMLYVIQGIAAKHRVDDTTTQLLANPFRASALSLEFLLNELGSQGETQASSQCPAEKSDRRATTARLFPGGIPNNRDILDLVVRLDAERSSGKSANQIAREFTGESDDDDRRAQSLLAGIRRMRREGRISL